MPSRPRKSIITTLFISPWRKYKKNWTRDTRTSSSTAYAPISKPTRKGKLRRHEATSSWFLVFFQFGVSLSHSGRQFFLLRTSQFHRLMPVAPCNVRTVSPRWESSWRDRKSTRLNSSHTVISYAVFCVKKKKKCLGADVLGQEEKKLLKRGGGLLK